MRHCDFDEASDESESELELEEDRDMVQSAGRNDFDDDAIGSAFGKLIGSLVWGDESTGNGTVGGTVIDPICGGCSSSTAGLIFLI